jgi:4-alpha-glucanotransferase
MAAWWASAPADEKAAVLAIPSVRARLTGDEQMRHVLIETLVACGADLLILPIQDAFGWRDRINQPATVSESNWTWRLPWPVDRMLDEQEAVDAAARLREWTGKYGR